MHRFIAYLVFGLLALGCGRGQEPAETTTTTPTTGAEDVPPPDTTAEAIPSTPEPSPEMGMTSPDVNVGPVSDQEVAAFADIYRRLVELEHAGAARIEGGEDAETVARELSPQVEQIFTESQLTPQRFDEIARAADDDDRLRQRIEAELEGGVESGIEG